MGRSPVGSIVSTDSRTFVRELFTNRRITMARKATSKKNTAVPPTTRAKASTAGIVTTQQNPSPVAQAAAAPKIDHSERVAALIVALNGGDADVARESAAELGRIGNADAVDALIAVIENKQGFYHGV